MEAKKSFSYNRRKTIISIVLTMFVFILFSLILYCNYVINKYDRVIFPNSYIQQYTIGEYSYDSLDEFLDFIDKMIGARNIAFVVNGNEYNYKYSDMGFSLDKNKMVNEIDKYQKKLNFFQKLGRILFKKKKVFDYEFCYDDQSVNDFLLKLKENVDVQKVDGHFVSDDSGVRYDKGTNSFYLDCDKSYEIIISKLSEGIADNSKIELVGSFEQANSNASYEKIDTMVSSFTTEFNPYIRARAQNLYTALNYINGVVVEPGEVFSYYKYAGPFNKDGYVFYYEFVGNGVCQIATTTYNAALIGGLEIIDRYPHAAKSVYVAGGLDATVASYSSGWYVDMSFRNTYDYPIYIKAYANGGKATVEFWSNHNAKRGYEYTTESVQIGKRGYKSYLHVWKDGVEVEKRYIATTWYSKDS